jgi:hypothetical protein
LRADEESLSPRAIWDRAQLEDNLRAVQVQFRLSSVELDLVEVQEPSQPGRIVGLVDPRGIQGSIKQKAVKEADSSELPVLSKKLFPIIVICHGCHLDE